MTCHVQIGKRPLCRCLNAYRGSDLLNLAAQHDIPAKCEHTSAADAVALVHLLQDFSIEACIVDGICEWNPAHHDLRSLNKRRKQ